MCNHKVRNINSVLPIYTDPGIYKSQTFIGNGNLAFENSTAKQAGVHRSHSQVRSPCEIAGLRDSR